MAHPDAAAPLAPGQVRVAVRAAGLNFRDVLNALGMYPGDAGPLGVEGAGVVIEVGPGVTDLRRRRPRDGAVRRAPSARSPSPTRALVARIPPGWSFAEAAAVPIVFLTAYYALVDLAAPASRASACSSTPRPAASAWPPSQLARHLGAEVFATASPGKWDTLRALGFDDDAHRLLARRSTSSRTSCDATDGRGVDVVLDCLAGEFVDASLRLLPRGGRFVEMGKTDIRDPTRSPPPTRRRLPRLRPRSRPGPTASQQMLAELARPLRARRAPPAAHHDLRHPPGAPRPSAALGQARHVGKVVLTAARVRWTPTAPC